MKTISIKHTFRATHAVASDPRLKEQHPHEWGLEVYVSGPLVGPGWVMDFGELRDIVERVLPPPGRNLNVWLCHDDATAERVAEVVHDQVGRRLPNGVQMVRVVLEEGPGNRSYWP